MRLQRPAINAVSACPPAVHPGRGARYQVRGANGCFVGARITHTVHGMVFTPALPAEAQDGEA